MLHTVNHVMKIMMTKYEKKTKTIIDFYFPFSSSLLYCYTPASCAASSFTTSPQIFFNFIHTVPSQSKHLTCTVLLMRSILILYILEMCSFFNGNGLKKKERKKSPLNIFDISIFITWPTALGKCTLTIVNID